jgi:hypothetical protein
MRLTTLKQVKIGGTLYIPDPVKGTNLFHKVVKMSSKEVFGWDGKKKLPINFPVFVISKFPDRDEE